MVCGELDCFALEACISLDCLVYWIYNGFFLFETSDHVGLHGLADGPSPQAYVAFMQIIYIYRQYLGTRGSCQILLFQSSAVQVFALNIIFSRWIRQKYFEF